MNIMIDSAVAMPDVQSSVDIRHIAIERVGVRGVRHPMLIAAESGGSLPTVGTWELTVSLPAHEKGTHMSRFVALLEQHRQTPMTPARFCDMAVSMLVLLNSEKGDIAASFPYFMTKVAPVSGVASLMDYEVKWTARVQTAAACGSAAANTVGQAEFELSVLVPVTSLCPCSKAISQYGAHNQRSHITVNACICRPGTG